MLMLLLLLMQLLALLSAVAHAGAGPMKVTDDWHYPTEEPAETAAVFALGLRVEALSAGSNTTGEITLRAANGSRATATGAGQLIFGWRLRGFLVGCEAVAAAADNGSLAILEHDATRWGRIEFVAEGDQLGAAGGPSAAGRRLRKGVGRTDAVRRPRYGLAAHDPAYFAKATGDPNDWIKRSMQNASRFGETTWVAAAARMVPTFDYAITGHPGAHTKFSVAPDGRVYLANFSIFAGAAHRPNVSGQIQPGVLLFDPKDFLSWWPEHDGNFSETKTSLVGRYTRAVAVSAWDVPAQRGFGLVAVPNARRGTQTQPPDTAELLVRLEEDCAAGRSTNAHPGPVGPRYFAVQGCVTDRSAVANAAAAAGTPGMYCSRPGTCWPFLTCRGGAASAESAAVAAAVELHDGGAAFHASLLAHGAMWDGMFEGTGARAATPVPGGGARMSVSLQYDLSEAARLVDMSRGSIAAAMTTFIGPRPNYGDGATYWEPGIGGDHGSYPIPSLALDEALLLWGHPDEAGARVEYYAQHYVRGADGIVPMPEQFNGNASLGPPGSIDLMHWNDDCSFADSLADLGRWLSLWADAARAKEGSGDPRWVARTWPQVKLMAGYVLDLRRNATEGTAGIAKGLIYGSAEFDECMHQQHWFSISAWAWRGLLQLQRFLVDTDAVAERPLASRLLAECAAFKRDLDAARDASLVKTASGAPLFIPPYAVANMTPYAAMPYSNRGTDEQDYGGGAAYANFRYWGEMLSSQFLGPELEVALSDFRESHLGTMSGLTRFRTHLDDMPATGYAYSSAATDRTRPFLSLLFGHIANYQSRGSFNAPEQLSFVGDGPSTDSFRLLMNPGVSETDIDMCVPAATLVSFMVRWMLVFEERDADTVWLLKMAPRRLYPATAATAPTAADNAPDHVRVAAVPTRFGHVSFVVNSVRPASDTLEPGSPAPALHLKVDVSLQLTGHGVVGAGGGLSLKIRLRDPSGGTRRLRTASVVDSTGRHTTLGAVDSAAETVQVDLAKAGLQEASARFKAAGAATQTNFTVLAVLA